MKRTLKKYATNEYGQRTSCNIDVRPLDQRATKRIKPGQSPDANEQLFFIDDNGPQFLDELLPAYARKLGFK